MVSLNRPKLHFMNQRLNTYNLKSTVQSYDLLRDIPLKTRQAYAESLLQIITGPKVLELGFGTGNVLIPMSHLAQDKNIVAVDQSPEMLARVEPHVAGNVQLISGSLTDLEGTFDAVHFKAILHCVDNPWEMITDMIQSVKPGGLIITSHEFSLTEDRIEQLFHYFAQQDSDVDFVFQRYFQLRQEINKPFQHREFPAGDSCRIVKHFESTGTCSLEQSIQPDDLRFERQITIQDILTCIRLGTFGVFYDGLTEMERMYLYAELQDICITSNIDIAKQRTMSCGFHINILKKHDAEPDIGEVHYLKEKRPGSDLPLRTQELLGGVESHTQPYQVQVCNKPYIVMPNVFSPKYFVNTEFYATLMAEVIRNQPDYTMLEIGSGTGIVSVEAALAGAEFVTAVDINSQAVVNTLMNANLHGVQNKLDSFESDTYAQVSSSNYHVIFYNTPFCYTDNQLQILEMSVADKGYQSVREYILHADRYLAPDGILFLGISYALSNFQLIANYLTQAGFTWAEVANTDQLGITSGPVYFSLIECSRISKDNPRKL